MSLPPLNPRGPTQHGFEPYSSCSRCGTQRPKGGLLVVGDAPPRCIDDVWCGEQVKLAGRLEP